MCVWEVPLYLQMRCTLVCVPVYTHMCGPVCVCMSAVLAQTGIHVRMFLRLVHCHVCVSARVCSALCECVPVCAHTCICVGGNIPVLHAHMCRCVGVHICVHGAHPSPLACALCVWTAAFCVHVCVCTCVLEAVMPTCSLPCPSWAPPGTVFSSGDQVPGGGGAHSRPWPAGGHPRAPSVFPATLQAHWGTGLGSVRQAPR